MVSVLNLAFLGHRFLDACLSLIDGAGLGKPIVEDMVKMGLPIRAVNVTKKVKLDLFRWLTVCFEQGKVVIPDHEKLLLQLKSLRRRYVKVTDDRTRRARLEISHPPGVNDDIVYALALALYLMQKEPKRKTHTHPVVTRKLLNSF